MYATVCVFIEGRSTIKVNAALFMAAASETYKLDNSAMQCLAQEGNEVILTSADINKCGVKIFGKI